MNIIDVISILAIPALMLSIVVYGIIKKVKIYEAFVEGAKEGFNVGVRIIPYLVAMLVAIGIFRAGGAMEILASILSPVTRLIGMPPEALPMAIIRPLSGSGALGVMSEIIKSHGPDSLIGRMVSVMMGSSETTFYVLAVYFGAVGITKTRQAVPAGIIVDIVAVLVSVWLTNLIFG
ncbi:MAG: spore maturation protein [Ignavibacteriae bacterium]|nr:spore maturation protein [Ignavibacteria bacterium]MBI3365183.1 spore maturation protein [Ignavibacteriota bacterium]